jgi:3-hydroxyisobutyrate dehydrogenase-like beta-hydroxyacid dehydrogenase
VAKSSGQVMREADLVFLSLPSGEIVAKICDQADGLLENCRSGQIIIDLSTSPVALTRELHAKFKTKGVLFIDAPVARTRAAAEAGTLSIMVGAHESEFAQVTQFLSTFATEITLCGTVGCGQVVKILNNMVLFETVAALSEARAIAKKAGVDPKKLFETLALGSADSFALRNHGLKAIIPGDFPERAFSVEYAAKDLRYALDLAQQADVDAAGARNVRRLFELSVARGDGDLYHPVISRLIEE